MTLYNTETLVLVEECERFLLPEGCDLERLDAIATEISRHADQPREVEAMLHQLGIPTQKWDWYEFDNRCRLVRLGELQPTPVDQIAFGVRQGLFANRLAQIVNTTLPQHFAEENNNPRITSLVASSQPQTDHLNAGQTNNFPLDPQLDLLSSISRINDVAQRSIPPNSSWKKTPMQLPAPSPNFPVSDVSNFSTRKTFITTFTETNIQSQVRNEGNGKKSIGPPPSPQHIDGPCVDALHEAIEAPDAYIEPLSFVRAPNLTGLPSQKQAELVLQQLRDHGERQKARDGKHRSVADELKKSQTQGQKEGGDANMGDQ